MDTAPIPLPPKKESTLILKTLLVVMALFCGYCLYKLQMHNTDAEKPPRIVYLPAPTVAPVAMPSVTPMTTPAPVVASAASPIPSPVFDAKPEASPPTPKRRLAPEGIFYVVEYVSVRTTQGVVGFEPGRQVHFVKANEEKGTLLVTDGKYQVEVDPLQLTNDLDLAAMALRQDQASQQQFRDAQENIRQAEAKTRQQIDIEHAKSVANLRTGSPVGGSHSPLDDPSQAASSFDRAAEQYGSPYYYLHRRRRYPSSH